MNLSITNWILAAFVFGCLGFSLIMAGSVLRRWRRGLKWKKQEVRCRLCDERYQKEPDQGRLTQCPQCGATNRWRDRRALG